MVEFITTIGVFAFVINSKEVPGSMCKTLLKMMVIEDEVYGRDLRSVAVTYRGMLMFGIR